MENGSCLLDGNFPYVVLPHIWGNYLIWGIPTMTPVCLWNLQIWRLRKMVHQSSQSLDQTDPNENGEKIIEGHQNFGRKNNYIPLQLQIYLSNLWIFLKFSWAVFKTPVGWWLVRGIIYYPSYRRWFHNPRTGIFIKQPGLNAITKGFWTLLCWRSKKQEATMADLRRSVEKALGMPPQLGVLRSERATTVRGCDGKKWWVLPSDKAR